MGHRQKRRKRGGVGIVVDPLTIQLGYPSSPTIMASLNALARELAFKVVYVGPGLSGKTNTLRTISANTRAEHRGEMVSIPTPTDQALEFDYLPIRVPHVHDRTIRLQLFTAPGQIRYDAARKMVLTGVDGIVFVADSQRSRADANVESLRNLEENLREQGRSLDEMPHVLQYNKRDTEDPVPISEMEHKLNLRAAPSFATSATKAEGIYEVLEAILRAVMEDYEQRASVRTGTVEDQLALPEGGLASVLRVSQFDLASHSESGRPKVNASPPDRLSGGLSEGVSPMGEGTSPDGPSSNPLELFSFATLWSEDARDHVTKVETLLATAQYREAILEAHVLISLTLKSAALEWPVAPTNADYSDVAWALGFDASRWRWLMSIIADVEKGRRLGEKSDALVVYACAIDLTLSHRHARRA